MMTSDTNSEQAVQKAMARLIRRARRLVSTISMEPTPASRKAGARAGWTYVTPLAACDVIRLGTRVMVVTAAVAAALYPPPPPRIIRGRTPDLPP